MNNNSANKIFTIVVYILTIILICFILYDMFLLIKASTYEKPSPKNSIKVSPISEDEHIDCYSNTYINELLI